tara:strand:- start:18 stop:1064 length:1047 start_codon:yes stop_codon:yes gene_type:complete
MSSLAVLLPCWNSSDYLLIAVTSILNQTFRDFDLYVVDDCSTDNSLSLLEHIKDRRLHVIPQSINTGYVSILNYLIDHTDSEYIARMDSDDISRIDRFEKQLSLLHSNPSLSLVGSWMHLINSNGSLIGHNRAPVSHRHIVHSLYQGINPICHPSIIFRRSILGSNLRYDCDLMPSEDYDFYMKLLVKGHQFSNYPDFLIKYRIHNDSISRRKREIQFNNTLISLRRSLAGCSSNSLFFPFPSSWADYILSDSFMHNMKLKFRLPSAAHEIIDLPAESYPSSLFSSFLIDTSSTFFPFIFKQPFSYNAYYATRILALALFRQPVKTMYNIYLNHFLPRIFIIFHFIYP